MSSATEPAAPRRGFDPVAYLKLFRFPLVFTAIADSATGYLLFYAGYTISWTRLAFLALTSAGLYFFGMSLNDIADFEKDKVGAPGKVLPSGRISLGAAKIACGCVLAASLTGLLLLHEAPLIQRLVVWGAAVFFILAYDLFLKIPPAMGLVRAANLLLGVAATMDQSIWRANIIEVMAYMALPEFVYVTALTYVSTLEDGIPHRGKLAFGAGAMVIGAGLACNLIPTAFAIRGIDHPWVIPIEHAPFSWRAALLMGVLALWILRRAFGAKDKKGIMLFVRDGVGGIIVLNAALLASLQPWYERDAVNVPFGVAALLIPAIFSVAIFKKLA